MHESCRKKELAAYAKGYAQGRNETYAMVLREAEKMLKQEAPCKTQQVN